MNLMFGLDETTGVEFKANYLWKTINITSMTVLSEVKKQESGLFDVYPRFDVTPVRARGYMCMMKDTSTLISTEVME